MDVIVIVGTRPEIIKTAPVIRAAHAVDRIELTLVHTNQHYDTELSDVFFETLGLDSPSVDLNVGSGTQVEQIADGIIGIERVLIDHEPDIVLAQGDTNAVLSTAIAASTLPVTFGHIEAGIRSGNRSMPEEINRILADQAAAMLFAPTEDAASNLADEGIEAGVHVTGNTIVDACRTHVRLAEAHSDILERHALDTNGFVVSTIHRPQNTNDSARLHAILSALDDAPIPVIFPAHPRVQQAINELDYEPAGTLHIIDPLDYLDFLALLSNAQFIVTDSGGIQEEASILQRPCLTVRPDTERPETINAGVNELVEPGVLPASLRRLHSDAEARTAMTGHPDLYGDGQAGERIVRLLVAHQIAESDVARDRCQRVGARSLPGNITRTPATDRREK